MHRVLAALAAVAVGAQLMAHVVIGRVLSGISTNTQVLLESITVALVLGVVGWVWLQLAFRARRVAMRVPLPMAQRHLTLVPPLGVAQSSSPR